MQSGTITITPDQATCYLNMGSALKMLNHYSDSRTMFEKALNIREQLYGLRSSSTAQVLVLIGSVIMEQKQFKKAEDYIISALEIYEETQNQLLEERRKLKNEKKKGLDSAIESELKLNLIEIAQAYTYLGLIKLNQGNFNFFLFYFFFLIQ